MRSALFENTSAAGSQGPPHHQTHPTQGIKAGQQTRALACLTDIYATVKDLAGKETKDAGGEDSFSLLPAFNGESQTQRVSLISHSIGGSFAIREGEWKLCLSAGSGGWSAPREAEAKKQKLPPLQLFNLKKDRSEQQNLVDTHPEKVNELMLSLSRQVSRGRSTPGTPVDNDRDITFAPKGVSVPESN